MRQCSRILHISVGVNANKSRTIQWCWRTVQRSCFSQIGLHLCTRLNMAERGLLRIAGRRRPLHRRQERPCRVRRHYPPFSAELGQLLHHAPSHSPPDSRAAPHVGALPTCPTPWLPPPRSLSPYPYFSAGTFSPRPP